MTLRCPNCGSKRLLFLSTTDGFAVGSTDQRYLCKDCSYRGSIVLDTGADKPRVKKARGPLPRAGWIVLLYILNIVLFALVLFFWSSDSLSSGLGFVTLVIWVFLFLASIIAFSSQLPEGSDQWFAQGMHMMAAVLVVFTLGVLFKLDTILVIVLLPIAAAAVYILEWLTTDISEDEFEKDLKRLSGELGN
ncbi:MAG: hypothetical protein JXB14_01435 [Candidatus Altiarchaeota archaeon]|nr:hypothetical protein [Candidatus Altiarchaeota archaeon]